MKATLEFELPEEEAEFEQASYASELQATLWDITQALRSKLKYEVLAEHERKVWEQARELVWDKIRERQLEHWF